MFLASHAARFVDGSVRQWICAVGVVALAACSGTEYVYKSYGGPEQPDSELAMIVLKDAVEARIGDRKVSPGDYARVQVLPGLHRIDWQCLYGVSVMVEPSGFASAAASGQVQLEAGHIYSLHCDRTFGQGYTTYQWITDDTMGETIAGKPKP
jgi:hypothetical protein